MGELESAAWVAYYRHEWLRLLRSAVSLTRHVFGLPWDRTVQGAWHVLRANQLWAPLPDNDPAGARRAMRRFYEIIAGEYGERFDPTEAARLEVEWWRIHREHQYGQPEREEAHLVEALMSLYGYVYDVPREDMFLAARERTLAMRHSDRWVSEGRVLGSRLIAEERAALVRSYAALLAVVQRI